MGIEDSMKAQVIAAVVAFACFSSAFAEEKPDKHICKEGNLSGIYSLKSLKEVPEGQESAWFRNYHFQYLIFNPNQGYDFVASRHPLSKPQELLKSVEMSKADAGGTATVRKYTLDTTGILTLYYNEKIDYIYRCMIIDSPSNGQSTGDIFLTGYSKTNTLLEKIFRSGQ